MGLSIQDSPHREANEYANDSLYQSKRINHPDVEFPSSALKKMDTRFDDILTSIASQHGSMEALLDV